MKKILITTVTLLTLRVGARAQVTIGSTTVPHEFSVLELESGGKRGLRLPQISLCENKTLTAQLKALTGDDARKAQGLQIFNTCSRCVETWNGMKWISACKAPEQDCVEMPAIQDCPDCICVPPVRFMKYNLGANPLLDSPKKQMEYLAEKDYTDATERKLDARVNGGLYQWGRKDHEHAVNASTLTRYEDTDNTWKWTYDKNNHTGDKTPIDSNGQPTGDAAGKFIYNLGDHSFNWYPNISYDAEKEKSDALWGNGYRYSRNFGNNNQGGVYYVDGYYQNTNRLMPQNDPCPAGFRVPTQDEWERLGAYGCNSSKGEGVFSTSIYGTVGSVNGTGKGLTWIPVVCNRNSSHKCVPDALWEINNSEPDIVSGYAIYATDVWEAAIAPGGVYAGFDGTNFPAGKSLHDAGNSAPEPLLFLPRAGYRNGGTPSTVLFTGQKAWYWSSTVSMEGEGSCIIGFESNNVYPDSSLPRGAGASIRCVVE